MTDKDVEKIAKKLTRPQRLMLMGFYVEYRGIYQVEQALKRKGLFGIGVSLTELGKAVYDYLWTEEQLATAQAKARRLAREGKL